MAEPRLLSCGQREICSRLRPLYDVNGAKFEGNSEAGVWSSLDKGVVDVKKFATGTSVIICFDSNGPTRADAT